MYIGKLPLVGIRKYWFIIGILWVIISPILLSQFLSFIGAEESLTLLWTVFWIIGNGIFFFILWYCACRKPGKKLLLIYLIIAPLSLFSTLLKVGGVQEGTQLCAFGLCFDIVTTETFNSYPVSYLTPHPWTLFHLICIISYTILFCCFYYFSFRLRKENQKVISESSI